MKSLQKRNPKSWKTMILVAENSRFQLQRNTTRYKKSQEDSAMSSGIKLLMDNFSQEIEIILNKKRKETEILELKNSLNKMRNAEVYNFLASLGHTGRRVGLGHTLNTLQHVITKRNLMMF